MNEATEQWQNETVTSDRPEPTIEEDVPVDPANMEKVREILFGSQARSFGRKLERLEERLIQETAQVREDFRARTAELEAFFRDEIAGVLDGLRSEERKRTSALAAVVSEMQTLAQTFDLRAEELDDQMGQSQRQLSAQITQTARELEATVRELTRRLERETRGLRDDKTDRATLATMLSEIATKLQQSPAGQ